MTTDEINALEPDELPGLFPEMEFELGVRSLPDTLAADFGDRIRRLHEARAAKHAGTPEGDMAKTLALVWGKWTAMKRLADLREHGQTEFPARTLDDFEEMQHARRIRLFVVPGVTSWHGLLPPGSRARRMVSVLMAAHAQLVALEVAPVTASHRRRGRTSVRKPAPSSASTFNRDGQTKRDSLASGETSNRDKANRDSGSPNRDSEEA